jgi:DNA-binding transcriptional regulator YdaS (Cro superfamily)
MLELSTMSDKNAALRRAIEAAGGLAKLAEPLGITVQAISQWDEVPPLRVLAVERVSGVPRSELRPDLYPVETIEARA